MHHIYHTEGIILGSKNFGEAGKYYHIFTRDLGMVVASAQGVRKMASKLRFILQDFSYVKVDLVRGRDFWRVTSASKADSLEDLKKNPEAFQVFSSISLLLKRLLSGEEPNKALFDDLARGLSILEKTNAGGDVRNIEAVIVLRILANLGYIGGNPAIESIAKSPFEENLVFEAARSRMNILKEINKAIRAADL